MHFLNANLLWLLWPLACIPLLIHWLSRRFPKRFAFSSIDDIRRSMAGRSRLFRWRHLLLLLLRTCALIALLLAFAHPLVTSKAATQKNPRAVLLMVDHSLSMSCGESGGSARSRAQAEVQRLLKSLDADNPFNLIRIDHAPTAAFTTFSSNIEGALRFLEQSPPPLTQANLHAANQLAARLAKERKGELDIYYFSDFQRRDWADVNFTMLPDHSRLFFVSATDDPQRPNQALVALTLGQGAVIAGGELEAQVRVANHSSRPWTGKIEAGFNPSTLRDTTITLPPWSEGKASILVPIPQSGLLQLTASLPEDDLPADNHRHLAVQVSSQEEVILLTGTEPNSAVPSPSLFLSTAVNPFDADDGVYKPKHLEPATLNPATIAASTRLIASRLPRLDDAQAGTLVTFLRGGGGVILFLDGDDDAANLRKIASLAGQAMPLELRQKLDSSHLPNGAMQVASGDFRSRFLKIFDGVRRQNLAQLEFYNAYHAAASGHGRILLHYTDGTPALAESTIGLGTLLICNFSVAETASNLAHQRLFPGWIHEMLLRINASGSAAMEPYLVGDTVSGEAWASDALGRTLIGPDRQPARCRSDLNGERIRISFGAKQTGFYQMPSADEHPLLAFAVNTDPEQSDLRTIDPSVLPDRAGQSQREASYVGTTTDYGSLLRGQPVYHWFLLAALAFLLAEGSLFKRPQPAA